MWIKQIFEDGSDPEGAVDGIPGSFFDTLMMVVVNFRDLKASRLIFSIFALISRFNPADFNDQLSYVEEIQSLSFQPFQLWKTVQVKCRNHSDQKKYFPIRGCLQKKTLYCVATLTQKKTARTKFAVSFVPQT